MNDYTGTDNLGVMASAVNYNGFLTKTVLSWARAGDQILDFGAGIGTFAAAISKEGYELTCVEPDSRQAAMVAQSGLKVHCLLDQVADASMDYIYTLNVLEHIENDQAALQQLKRKLKPGGRLLIYVPAFQILYSSMDRKVGHYRRYTASSLANLARTANFRIAYVRYVDCIGFFATLLYKLVGGETGNIDSHALTAYDRYVFPVSRLGDLLLGHFFGKNVLVVVENK
jgi:SAM-dependent methyltransferase